MEKSTFTPYYDLVREALVALRHEAEISQRELAARLGREHSFVSRIELGERRVDIVELYWICQACGAEPGSVFSRLVRGFREVDVDSAE